MGTAFKNELMCLPKGGLLTKERVQFPLAFSLAF